MDGNLPDNEAQMGFWARKGPWKISALMKKECSCDPQRGTWESVIKDRLGGLLHTQEGHSRELVTFFPELEGKAEAGWSFQTSLVCCGGPSLEPGSDSHHPPLPPQALLIGASRPFHG